MSIARAQDFIAVALAAYERAAADAMRWMLARPPLHGVFLNTKVNSLTLQDYTDADGWRGPRFLFGWIQGRGLEALARHAAFFETRDAGLSAEIDLAGRRLYARLSRLFAAHGRGYFLYDERLMPVWRSADGRFEPQLAPSGLRTYSDVFILKGLIAAAHRYDRAAAPAFVRALLDVVAAIEDRQFVMNEQQLLDAGAAAREPDDYAPRMILLGAAVLLRDLGFDEHSGFGARFAAHVIDHHASMTAAGPILSDMPGGATLNPGHAIEFAGFAFEYFGKSGPRETLAWLRRSLAAAFHAGFDENGIRLKLSWRDQTVLNDMRPWWPLAETIRASARAYAVLPDPQTLDIWRQAHAAFFTCYWRETPAFACQTRSATGPVDYVPATPDLDPGYHSGLSFLSAIDAFARPG